MTSGTGPLGTREDSVPVVSGGRILASVRPCGPDRGGFGEMADVAYVLVFASGFVLLALVLRGLERL